MENYRLNSMIELTESKEKFKIIKVFPGGFVDLLAVDKHKIIDNYYETLYSIQLKNYRVLIY